MKVEGKSKRRGRRRLGGAAKEVRLGKARTGGRWAGVPGLTRRHQCMLSLAGCEVKSR